MDIATFKSVASRLPAEIAVLMRGPTGIGSPTSHVRLPTRLAFLSLTFDSPR